MKNILHLVLACLLLAIKTEDISGQEFTYSLLDTRDGLPAAAITALAEDLEGHLWIGTEGGLVRYNGYAFEYFFDDPSYIPGKVNAMEVDQLGNIWIGTNTGLARFFEGSFHPVSIAGLDTMSIQRMATTRNGKIVIATIYDLFILDGIEESAFTYQRYAFPGILYLSEDRAGDVIWIGTIDDLKKYENGRIKEVINRSLTHDEGVINVWSQDNKLLIGTEDDNIFLYDPLADKLQSVLPYQNDFGDFVGFQIWNNQLWHIYGHMVLKQSDTSEIRINYPANWSIKSVKTSLVDSDGNLWLGSTEGLIRIRKSCFVNLTFPGITHEIYSLMEDDLHTTWIGTNSGLIYQWDESGVREWKAPEDFGGEVIDMIQGDAGEIWIASYWQGLLEIDQTGTTHYSVEEISELGPDIYDIHLDQDHNLWVGSYRGVFIKKDGEKQFIYGDSLGLPDQCDVYEIQDGLSGVWIAASCGLYHKREGKLELVHLPDLATDVSIRCLLVDENLLWIGTIGFGLRCYQIMQDGLKPLVVIDQPDRTILDIEKRQRKVWAGTPRVLLEINPDANFHFNIFSSTEGFFEEGYAFLKLFVNHRNELFVTTSRGLKKLVDFDLPSGSARNLIINHLLADGSEIDLNHPTINVPSTTKIIELSYYYPDITRTDFLSYQWKMSDQDEWTDWSNKREINLYSPRPGPYQMEIRVKEANKMLNSKHFNFYVEYAWYQQKWIQIVAGFFLGFIVYHFFTRREKSLRLKQELETQRKLAMASLESRALKAQM
ncbi:MAG: hypothetical protein KDC80_07945, partial [Saprospiraceae bacterium]|nr:hypothetical protein [Saprospiraceae bacterium]